MAHFSVDVDRLDIGDIETIEAREIGWSKSVRKRLEIAAIDGTVIEADMPPEVPADALELLEFAWLCLTYGDTGSDYEAALADLRAAKAAHDARAAAERAP